MMKTFFATIALIITSVSISTAQDTTERSVSQISAAQCDWYIVVGCGRDARSLRNKLEVFGGPEIGGGAGMSVIETEDYPNFRNGYFCLVDGPYETADHARSIAWVEAVPDAYVKKGC